MVPMDEKPVQGNESRAAGPRYQPLVIVVRDAGGREVEDGEADGHLIP